jgi:hypothetical protein
MWRLFNKLFGWHYVSIASNSGDYRYLRRVRKTEKGILYIDFLPGEQWFLLDEGKVDNGRYKWVPLTW